MVNGAPVARKLLNVKTGSHINVTLSYKKKKATLQAAQAVSVYAVNHQTADKISKLVHENT